MLSRSFTSKILSRSKLGSVGNEKDLIRSVPCLFNAVNGSQYVGPTEEKERVHLSISSATDTSIGGHVQVRFSHTESMPKMYKIATDVSKYKKEKDVPFSVQKNIAGYSMMMFAGGTLILMGKAVFNSAINFMGPPKSALAASSLTVDLSKIDCGSFTKVKLRGRLIYVVHRPSADIKEMQMVPLKILPHPEEDGARFPRPQWLVVEAVCPHLGCAPTVGEGDYHGFFCPCHGSHFDKSGRIRKGPSPSNLAVPNHRFIDENTLVLGS